MPFLYLKDSVASYSLQNKIPLLSLAWKTYINPSACTEIPTMFLHTIINSLIYSDIKLVFTEG